MIRAKNLRKLMKDVGPANYKAKLRELLGVETEYRDTGDLFESGYFPAKLNKDKRQIGADEISIRDLAEEFLGTGAVASMHNSKTADGSTEYLREALSAVQSSQMQDINAFNQTVGGLIEVRILEGYQLPEFIATDLVETMPTRVNGGKLIGIPNVSLPDGPTPEGQEYPSQGLLERWAVAQENVKYGLKMAVTREAMVYDLTGELLNKAESIGQSLGYLKEYWLASVCQGVDIAAGTPGFVKGRTCNTFIYKGLATDTPNATYQTAAGTGASAKYNYVNSLSNTLTDYTTVQAVQAKLNLMKEFETGYPIRTSLDDVVVSPNKEYNARAILHATQVLPVSAGGLSTTGGIGTFSANPIPQRFKLYSSQIWNRVLTDSGISQANADIYWFAGSLRKAFVWRSVWDLSVVQANPLTNEMLERDVVNAFYASWYGVPVVRDPHYVVLSTN